MANPFDQFDTQPGVPTKVVTRGGTTAVVPATAPAQQAAPAANPFDQFDAPAAPAATGPRSAEDLQAEFGALPWYSKAGQAADDIMRLGANGLTFGFADKAAGFMGGDTEAERIKTEEARRRAGLAGDVAEIGSSLAVPLGAAKGGATLIGRFGTEAMKGVPGVLARAGLAAGEGAGYGALDAAGHDKDMSDGALVGAVMGGAGSTILDGARKVGQAALRGSGNAGMTVDQARAAADRAYAAAENAGVMFTPRSVGRVQNDVTSKLADFGYDPKLQPGAAAVLDRLGELTAAAGQQGGGNITLKGWDTLRKVASNGFIKDNPANNKVVEMMIASIDDAVENPRAGELLMGDAKKGAAALNEARGLWSRVAKSNRVESAMTNADFQSDVNVTGNLDRQIRSKMNALRQNGGARGFTPEENAALETAIRGTFTQNAAGQLGRFSPQRNMLIGSALGGAGGTAAVLSNPVAGAAMLSIPAAGFLADKAANSLSRGNVQELLNIIMNGGKAMPPTATQSAVQGAYDPLIRAIIAPGQGTYTPPPEQR